MKNGDKIDVMTYEDAQRIALSLIDALYIGISGIEAHGFRVDLGNGKFEDGEFIGTGSIDSLGIRVHPIAECVEKEFAEIQLGNPLEKLTPAEVIDKLRELTSKIPAGAKIMGVFKCVITTHD